MRLSTPTLFLVLLTIACSGGSGGGGGGGGAGATAPAITAQPQSQTVISGEPASFTVSATGSAPLAYQWRRNGADIPGATQAQYGLPATVPADSAGTFAVVVSNSAGSVTSANATLTVVAAQQIWEGAQKIQAEEHSTQSSKPDSPVETVVAASNDHGDAVVVWTKVDPAFPTTPSTDDYYVVRASIYAPSTGWMPWVRIDDGDFSASVQFPQVAMDANGNALVVYVTTGLGGATGDNYIMAARYTPAAGWTAPVTISQPARSSIALSGVSFPTLAMAPDGRAITGWGQNNPSTGKTESWVARFDPASGWTAPELVSATLSSAWYLPVGIGPSGHAVVAFRNINFAVDRKMYAIRYVPGTGWTAPEVIGNAYGGTAPNGGSAQGNFTFQPVSIEVDGNGDARVAWNFEKPDGPGDNTRVYEVRTARYSSTSGWSGEETISNVGTVSVHPEVGWAADGRAVATWYNQVPNQPRFELWSSQFAPGSGWSAPAKVGGNVLVVGKMATNSAGQAVLTYTVGPLGLTRAKARQYDPASGWFPEVDIDEPGTGMSQTGEDLFLFTEYLRSGLTLDGHGTAIAAWPRAVGNPVNGLFDSVWVNRAP